MSTVRPRAFAVLVTAWWVVGSAEPRVTALAQALRDKTVAPVFEGFQRNPDGTFDLLFGYFNRNWDAELDAPIGPANHIEPGGPDRGQPTHFLPRRNRFVFRVRVPADFGSREMVWTLVTQGETLRAYGTLKPLYEVDDIAIAANLGAGGPSGNRPDIPGNKPPRVKVDGEKTRSVRVGEATILQAIATDDGSPRPRPMAGSIGQDRTVPTSATGLRVSWFVYRGTGDVTFDPPQAKVWEDLRDGGNSPWSVGWTTPPLPADDRWTTRVTFKRA